MNASIEIEKIEESLARRAPQGCGFKTGGVTKWIPSLSRSPSPSRAPERSSVERLAGGEGIGRQVTGSG